MEVCKENRSGFRRTQLVCRLDRPLVTTGSLRIKKFRRLGGLVDKKQWDKLLLSAWPYCRQKSDF
jgi:hypothetical protein